MSISALSLGRDELRVFLTIIGSTTMNGLDEERLAGLDDREIAERLNGGEQSLINRGLLDLDRPGEAMLDDTLVALVGSSVVPDATFLLTLVNPDGSNDPHYFNATPELLVEHHSPKVGIHQFEHLPTVDDLAQRMKSLLSLLEASGNGDKESVKAADLQIDSTSLSQFIELVQENALDQARSVLTGIGMATSDAKLLVEDYTTYPSWVGVVAWDLRTQEPQSGETVMVIGGDSRCWLLENMVGQENQVRLHQASGDACIAAMMRLVQPIEQTYQPSSPKA